MRFIFWMGEWGTLFLFLFLPAFLIAADTTPVDRYGGHYGAPADEYGVTYHFHTQPHINDFEYRAILEDIFTISRSSALGSCARYKVIELLLEKRIDPYLTYPVGVFRSSIPFNEGSLISACKEGVEPLTFQ